MDTNYNDEPVFYCKECLSLKIQSLNLYGDIDYCCDCGSTDIATAHIEEWEKLYQHKYGYKLLDKKRRR